MSEGKQEKAQLVHYVYGPKYFGFIFISICQKEKYN